MNSGFRVVALCLLALLSGCGSGFEEGSTLVQGGAPVPSPSGAVSELELAAQPDLRVDFEGGQLAAMVMEPEGGASSEFDSGSPGVDVVPFRLNSTQSVSLSFNPGEGVLERVVLREAGGRQLFALDSANPSQGRVLAAGDYLLELDSGYQAPAGFQGQGQVVFVTPVGAVAAQGFFAGLKLTATGNCEGCNFRNSSLSFLSLTNDGFQLRPGDQRLNLRRADLTNARGRRSNLKGIDFSNAKLVDADLREVNLVGAILRDVDARGTNFRGARLGVADLVGANLRGADLRGADCNSNDFSGADLRNVLAAGAHMLGNDFSSSLLDGGDFSEADLRGCKFVRAQCRGTNFRGARLERAVFTGADVAGADFRNAQNLDLNGALP